MMPSFEVLFRLQGTSPFAQGQPLRGFVVRGLARRSRCPERAKYLYERVAAYGAEAFYGTLPSGLWAAVLHGKAGYVFAYEAVKRTTKVKSENVPVCPQGPKRMKPEEGDACAIISPWTVEALRAILRQE